MKTNKRQPNKLLKRERELRCWTHEQMADALEQLCQQEPRAKRRSVVNGSMISRWERGIHPPNLFYQRMLCQLFEQSAQALGFVEPLPDQNTNSASPTLQLVTGVPSTFPQMISHTLSSRQALDVLCAPADDSPPEQQLGAWLALSAQHLAPLFEARWTPQMVLEALHV